MFASLVLHEFHMDAWGLAVHHLNTHPNMKTRIFLCKQKCSVSYFLFVSHYLSIAKCSLIQSGRGNLVMWLNYSPPVSNKLYVNRANFLWRSHMLKFTARNYLMRAVTNRHLQFASHTDPGVILVEWILSTSFSHSISRFTIIFSMESFFRNLK